ncbi:MAG: glycosyltransferase [Planctomycetes bacterium]|nr:glycosyltransferase [Planctomycetota bacterium]
MRVLQVMECTIGGTRRHLRDLVFGLHRRGVSVEVVAAALREPRMRDDMRRMRAAGITVHEIPMVRPIRPLTDLRHGLRLARVLCDRGFDVIHTHSSKAGALGRGFGALLSGAVRVHTPHTYAFSFDGGHGQGGEPAGPPGLILATERILGRVTHRLVHVSAAELEEGQALGVIPRARARVVPNGVDPAAFGDPSGGEAVRAELGIPADAPLVGTVGLLNDAKGHDLLLDALARLPDGVHLMIVGMGEREPDLRAQAERLGISARMHITGWRDDVLACYDAMDVFVLSSRWEGLSYALLEAMASGRPCVSTDVNGSREALLDGELPPGGVVVQRLDVESLASAVRDLLTDAPGRAALGEAARERVAARFTVDAMVDATIAVYDEVLRR